MNGFIKRSVAVLCLGGAAAVGGCCKDGALLDCYDHCWEQRYSAMSNSSVNGAFAAQVNNGHVLDQTVWTYHFKAGTAELTAGGLEQLAYLARRRPQPDPHIYLQTAQDVAYDDKAPEKYAIDRAKLDNDRREAILKFLAAETAGRPVNFEVAVHDPSSVGYYSTPLGISVQKHYGNFQGALPAGAVGGAGSGSSTPR
jgi:hypothetical protein